MKAFHSIQWRIQLWHGLLLAAVLVGFGFTAWRLQWANQIRRTDQDLQQRISVLANLRRSAASTPSDFAEPPPFIPSPAQNPNFFEEKQGRVFYCVIWTPDSSELVRSHTAPSNVPRPNEEKRAIGARMRGSMRECFHFSPRGDCFLVGIDIHNELADLRRFAWLLAGIGALVLMSGLAGGRWISNHALRPISDISAAAEKISNGNLAQRINTTNTESELGQLARVLNSTFARLETAFNQQARFTADAAHELRTPVAVMLTHCQNGLASECSNPEHREAFEASHRAAQRMRRLTESLLQLARLDSGATTAATTLCELDHITRDVLELLRPLAKEQGVCVQAQFESVRCEGDAEQLAQVVSNLVNNAICYNRLGGNVQVTVCAQGQAAVLKVTDTGQGIGAEHLPHLFERFYRVDKSRSNRSGHTGLGLAIVKAIIEAHNGEIQVTSELGKGSTFTVRIPPTPAFPK